MRQRRKRNGRAWIGTSGYSYRHWAGGAFYPEKLAASKWLEHYATRFDTVETNGTFYKLPAPSVFQNWYERTPDNFRFFVKGSRFVTHFKHLKDPQPALERFFNAVAPLREKLAGVLWQLPAAYKLNFARLREFVEAFRKFSPVPLALEFRHPGWFTDEVTELLRAHDAVYCRADAPEFYLDLEIPDTAGYAYYRRHGAGKAVRYSGNYAKAALQRDAREMKKFLTAGKDVYVYFNNDIGAHAPRNAQSLRRLL